MMAAIGKISIPVLLLLMIGCGNRGDSSGSSRAELPSGDRSNFNYQYPENVFEGRVFGGSELDFYPIGFSKNGQFAFLERRCDRVCGCCQHELVITDLLSDKVVDRYNLRMGQVGEADHSSDWESQFQGLTAFLRKYGISQVQLPLDIKSRFDFIGHSYEVMVQTGAGSDEYGYPSDRFLQYIVRVQLDNSRLKVVTKGQFQDGEAFTYVGYLKSPYDNQLALLFNKSYFGSGHEHINEVVVIGCNLSTKYWGVPGY